jgi:hypothetical protein
MTNPVAEAFEQGKVLGDQLRALEERAGIAAKVEDASLGSLFPDLKASADQYFMETEDYARRKTRDLYFGVQDEPLRKQLIAKRRECDRFHEATLHGQVKRAHQALAKARQRATSLPWLWAGCIAAFCVALGAWYFQLYGAIAGALVGFFAGQGLIASARNERAEKLRTAQADLDEEQKTVREVGLQPDWFNANEERTGKRDESFDHESVIANFYASQREGRA